MNNKKTSTFRQTWLRALWAARLFSKSDAGPKARVLAAALLTLMLGVNGLNVLSSYVSRNFMSAIAAQNMPGFIHHAILWIAVFAGSTIIAVIFRFAEERLGLLWREWLTRRTVTHYLDARTYLHLHATGGITNPDQRVAEDIRTFTTMTLSFVLMLLNATLTVVAFVGVLWTISWHLLCVAVGYAVIGSILTIFFGRPLMRLNYSQFDKEANFRADLIHVGDHADSIALQGWEDHLGKRLQRRVDDLVANFRRIIGINRNLGFFTTGYNHLIQIIPILIVAPMFIHGKFEFGVIAQSAMAFAALTGAFSLIVTQFQSISSYASVVTRLSEMTEMFDKAREDHSSGIQTTTVRDSITFNGLSVRDAENESAQIRDLTYTIPHGSRVLVNGGKNGAKENLFRATAGLHTLGNGRIGLPADTGAVAFLPDHPYLPPGTLRELLNRRDGSLSDKEVEHVLSLLNAEGVVSKAGGLDCEQPWGELLSLEEKQLVAVARVLLNQPRFVLLRKLGSTLDVTTHKRVLDLLTKQKITYVSIGNGEESPADYDVLIGLGDDGSWKATPLNKPPTSQTAT